MADPLSIQIMSSIYASRSYAVTRLTQDLNSSVTGVSLFVRSYLVYALRMICVPNIRMTLDAVLKRLTLRQFFDCFRKSGLRLTSLKCDFGMAPINFLKNTVTSKEPKPGTDKIENILKIMQVRAAGRQVELSCSLEHSYQI